MNCKIILEKTICKLLLFYSIKLFAKNFIWLFFYEKNILFFLNTI